MVPEGWEKSSLGSLSIIVTSGSRDWAKYYSSSGAKFIRMTNLSRDGIRLKLDNLKFVNIDYSSADGKRTKLQQGDILISITAELGKIGLDPTKANSKFAAYVLSSIKMNHLINRMNDSGAKAGLNLPTIKSIPILVPTLEKQNKIAHILSTWDKAINVAEKLVKNSQAQKKALMQQLLTGKRCFLELSKKRRRYQLGDLGVTFSGLINKTKEDFGEGKPFIPYINIFANSRVDINSFQFVSINEHENQSKAKYGDIFFTTSSETANEVGMSSVLLDDVDELYLNSFCFGFRLNNLDTLLPEYARYLLRSQDIRKQVFKLAQGATRYNLSKKELMKIKLDLPVIEEQKKASICLSNKEKEIKNLKNTLSCLKAEKKALMQQLLTGKRRVKIDKAKAASG